MGNQGQMVRKYMAMRLKQWEKEPNDARVKGELAQLRHGIGIKYKRKQVAGEIQTRLSSERSV